MAAVKQSCASSTVVWRRPRSRAAMALLLASAAWAQQPAALTPDADYACVQQQLQADPRPTTPQRIALLEAFRSRHDAHPTSIAVLRARLHLGLCYLESFQAEAARVEFAAVDTLAPPHEFDLHGRALYGMAQADELLGDTAAAQELLRQLRRKLDGSRYADIAQVALNRLGNPGQLVLGEPLPPLLLGKDVLGRTLSLQGLRGKPLLLVFFAADHDASMRQLEQLAKTWLDNGMPEDGIVAFALQSDTAALKTLVEQRNWRFPVLPGDDGFLHQDWMQLHITGTPSNWVVGRNGSLLLHDVTPARLALALKSAH